MACSSSTCLPTLLTTAATREEVHQQAENLGVVRRSRKVDPFDLLMTFVLGVSVRGPTVLAHLHRVWCRLTGVRLARSSYWDRLTPRFTALVKWLLDRTLQQARDRPVRLPRALSWLRDIFAVDSSVIQVADDLQDLWPGTRHNSAPASIKLHATVRVFTGEIVRYKVTGERTADCKAFGVSHRLRGCLVLLDRGYSSPSLWRRIANVGGYFLTRLPADRDPEIVADHRQLHGRSRALVGRRLKSALRGLKRDVVDVDCAFRCRVRKYRTQRDHFETEHFRVVALRNPKTGTLTRFVTNVPPSRLPAELVGRAYRLRWEVELFFKAAKSGLGLHELPSTKPHIVKALVYAAILRISACMQDRVAFLKAAKHPRAPDINPLAWMDWWRQQLPQRIVALLGRRPSMTDEAIAFLLADPNRKRPTTRRVFRFWQEAA